MVNHFSCVFQALQKLASQYLKRDWPGINPDDQRTDYRWVYLFASDHLCLNRYSVIQEMGLKRMAKQVKLSSTYVILHYSHGLFSKLDYYYNIISVKYHYKSP